MPIRYSSIHRREFVGRCRSFRAAYSTLHVFLGEGLAADGSPADWISASNANEFGAGDCFPAAPTEAVSKGKVVIAVK